MRLADYLINSLPANHVFLGSGGGMLYLSDAVSRAGLPYTNMHHEQSLGYAAVGYAKALNSPAVAIATSGCGGTNMITPCLVAWQDSVPVIFITGQDYRDRTINYTKQKRRQLGIQECDIIPIVKSITKYATQINSTQEAKRKIGKAIRLANTGRPGPVWIVIPLDLQCEELS